LGDTICKKIKNESPDSETRESERDQGTNISHASDPQNVRIPKASRTAEEEIPRMITVNGPRYSTRNAQQSDHCWPRQLTDQETRRVAETLGGTGAAISALQAKILEVAA
jgi:hypothetical protein